MNLRSALTARVYASSAAIAAACGFSVGSAHDIAEASPAATVPGCGGHCHVNFGQGRHVSGAGPGLAGPGSRIAIDDTAPAISGGWPAKAVVDESFPVRAVVWREGHDAVAATLAARDPQGRTIRNPMRPDQEPDVFNGVLVPHGCGEWTYWIEAWDDPLTTWRAELEAKLAAGQGTPDLDNTLEAGARLLTEAAQHLPAARNGLVLAAAAALRGPAPLASRVAPAFGADLGALMREYPLQRMVTRGPEFRLSVERRRALSGAWYEYFPRSTGGRDSSGRPQHGTFATAAQELGRIAAMGFDVVYLPPIHPIGRINRKGPNNALTAAPDDVGSPWAIGADEGGHDAIHPRLGSETDFRDFIARAAELGLEVALDLALQCAPDHPWAAAHPEWFTTLPDGTIAYAENPPKKYQDIYPLNFDNDTSGLSHAILDVVRHWINLGVRIFRVDNPHTKPVNFWEWLIPQIRHEHPDAIFLAEAFTRPARLYGLARRGFSQSYTYFTWRTSRAELTSFARELAEKADESRPNLFVNTPDILHESLQHGGPGMFAIRAVLAATLSPSWGMYSGFELFEHQALHPGSEEYLDSEKYQLRPRDYRAARDRGESLEPWITRLNTIRRAHPALQQLRCITFHDADNAAILAYSKTDPATGDTVLMVVNLNPFATEYANLCLDLPAIGREWHDRFHVTDEVTGETYHWGHNNFVKLDPARAAAHILAMPPVPMDARAALAHRRSLR